jgi:predicted lipoprotein with Yx(FWY)xxD motif
MRNRWWATTTLAAAALTVAACGSSGGSSAGSSSPAATPASTGSAAAAGAANIIKVASMSGSNVLTNAKGFTLYWFVPDTSTQSNCNGSCAKYWPPVKGAVTGATGLTGKFGTIKRSDGSLQATYDGHPLYTYVGDTKPGEAKGNGLNISGGVWHEVVEGVSPPAAKPSSSHSSSSSSNGYGY